MNSDDYIKKWLEGTLSEEEKLIFKASPEFKYLEKLSKSTEAFRAPDYNVHAELKRLNRTKSAKGKVISMRLLRPMLRVAAILIVLIGSIFYFYLNVNTSIQTAAAEKTDMYLPDSSRIVLNAFTQVSYKENMWKYNRQVNLDGEAFFKVAKGSKFNVKTTSGIISVLGTQFNVKNRDNYFEVVCYEGLVEVTSSGNVAQLPRGHSLRIINGVLDKRKNLNLIFPSWIINESSFLSVPFGQVIREFEIQYNVKVISQDVNLDQLFTGKFIHNNQNLALQTILIPLNLNYVITEENQIILSGKGD